MRPGFVAPLDHKQHALKEVLSNYYFEREIPCGLKACRQGHKSGFLVLTESGTETNIGHNCGKSHFGEEVFVLARDTYAKLRERADLVKVAHDLQAEIPAICKQVDDVAFTRKYSGRWVTSVRKEIYALIGPVLDSLEMREKRREYVVTESRERTEKEIESLMAGNRALTRVAARYEQVGVGSLSSMPWITFDFRKRLIVDLQGPLQAFALVDPHKEPSPSLKALVKRFEGRSQALRDAEDAASSAIEFLSEQNLKLVARCVPDFQRSKADALLAWIGGATHKELLKGAP